MTHDLERLPADTDFEILLGNIIALQRSAQSREGRPAADVRIDRLQRVANMLAGASDDIAEALSIDFGHRSIDETKFEIFGAVSALRSAAASVDAWMAAVPRSPITPDAEAWVEFVPKGVVGVMGPWNYPIFSVFAPLAGVLAAGNRAIIKPSEFVPVTSALLDRLIRAAFPADELAIVHGGASEGAIFAGSAFDHLMFTGSTSVGRQVMRAAADRLTPVTLELGGKCPVIVGEDYDLAKAAERIMAVKARNAGQICVAPDYVMVPAGCERVFAQHCVDAAQRMFPAGLESEDYTSIINDKNMARLETLLIDAREKGGELIPAFTPAPAGAVRRMGPVVILNTRPEMAVMRDEIFGPVLPVLGYRGLEGALAAIGSGASPLALYYFGDDDTPTRTVLDRSLSGGVTLNDVMAHLLNDDLPFGGIGPSGMGAYRGHAGFQTFSHPRAIYRQSDASEAVRILQAPYGEPFRQFLSMALAVDPASATNDQAGAIAPASTPDGSQ